LPVSLGGRLQHLPLIPRDTAVRIAGPFYNPEEKKKKRKRKQKDNMGVAGTKRNVRTRRPTPRTTGGRLTFFNLAARLVFIIYLKFQSFSLMGKPLVMCGANNLPALIEF